MCLYIHDSDGRSIEISFSFSHNNQRYTQNEFPNLFFDKNLIILSEKRIQYDFPFHSASNPIRYRFTRQ